MRWIVMVLGCVAAAAMGIAIGGGGPPPTAGFDEPASPAFSPKTHGPSAEGTPDHTTVARSSVPGPGRADVDSLAERLAAAPDVRAVVALLRQHGPRPADDGRACAALLEEDLRAGLVYDEERLAKLLASPLDDDAARWREFDLRVNHHKDSRTLRALRSGHYAAQLSAPNLRGRVGPYELAVVSYQHLGYQLVIVHRWPDGAGLRQLQLQLDHHRKVAEFNALPEKMRRSVLRLRHESLATGDPDERAWLPHYFPEGCVIDERMASIH